MVFSSAHLDVTMLFFLYMYTFTTTYDLSCKDVPLVFSSVYGDVTMVFSSVCCDITMVFSSVCRAITMVLSSVCQDITMVLSSVCRFIIMVLSSVYGVTLLWSFSLPLLLHII